MLINCASFGKSLFIVWVVELAILTTIFIIAFIWLTISPFKKGTRRSEEKSYSWLEKIDLARRKKPGSADVDYFMLDRLLQPRKRSGNGKRNKRA